jgi:hypothetical protein
MSIEIRNEAELQAVAELEKAIERLSDTTPAWLWDKMAAAGLADFYEDIDRALGEWERIHR